MSVLFSLPCYQCPRRCTEISAAEQDEITYELQAAIPDEQDYPPILAILLGSQRTTKCRSHRPPDRPPENLRDVGTVAGQGYVVETER